MNDKYNLSNIFIIGGEAIYKQALDSGKVTEIYYIEIYDDFECDTFFPNISTDDYKLTYVSKFYSENNIYYRYKEFNCHKVQIEQFKCDNVKVGKTKKNLNT